ncbi:MAG: hypothetical protein ACOYJ2_04920 [Rickettsiales bacterium]
MKFISIALCLLPLALAACGSDTVVHEQPIVVQQPAPVIIQR